MSLTKAYTLYAASLDKVGADDIWIDQISDQSLSPNVEMFLRGADGGVDDRYAAVMSQAPSIRLTTSKLATVLAKCGIAGLAIDADANQPGLRLWFQKFLKGGTRTTGNAHLLMTCKEGMLVPRVLNAPHNGEATLQLEALLSYNGTNAPILVADGQALTGVPTIEEIFTAGPAYINGTELEGVQNVSIDFGLTVKTLGASGEVWPRFIYIAQRRPLITIRTLDVSVLATFGLSGVTQSGTDSLIYLRKVAKGALRVADAEDEHIQIAVDDGMIYCRDVSGSHNAEATAEVVIQPIWDGENDVLQIDTAAIIA